MRRWHPDVADEDLDEVYAALPPPDRDRWVALMMVAAADGALTVGGVSGPLGGDGDLAAFRALRAAADVVMVGAGTARAEGYGPVKVRPALQERRRGRGQPERPPLAIVTRSLDLTGAEAVLDADPAPWIVTCAAAPADALATLRDRGATVVVAGDDTVDLVDAFDQLAASGLDRVVVEGGPRLNHDLVAAGVADELFLTIAPTLVGGTGPRLVGDALPDAVGLRLLEGRQHGDDVLLRYAIGRQGDG